MEKWTEEQAWTWYHSYPWLRGCNFIGSDCANRRDQWQSYHAEEHLATADRELELAHKIGFNTVRLILDFDVWYQEPEHFLQMVESYISLCDKHEQYVMLVLSNEAELPDGDFNAFQPKPLGEQEYALGYHQGRSPEYIARTSDKTKNYHPLESPLLRESYLEMVRTVVTKYREDKRVICWNIYNEPGIVLKERSIPLLQLLFEEVRRCDPIQPLTADLFTGTENGQPKNEQEKVAIALSDVISFHSYDRFSGFCLLLADLKKYNRPLFCTEWLCRILHNNPNEIFPLLYLENIACWCWGFVLGKTQTNEPWYAMWKTLLSEDEQNDWDVTKWMHDLFRPSLLPYDPKELKIIRQFTALADKDAKK